jgi:probable O-glycosylation ligase (exosortase A-associated)
MRDVIVTLIVLGSLPFIFTRPWIGILMWSWLAYMSPHRLTWGFAYSFNFSLIVGGVTVLAFLLKGEKKLPKDPLLVALIGFTLFTCLTTALAIDPEPALWKWDRFMKIQFMTVLTIFLIVEQQRLIALMWVIALSLGFYGLKGGVFGLMGGGENLVWGPPGSFIEDNNSIALALCMTVPFLYYVRQQATNAWLRRGLLFMTGVTAVAVLGTYSRGGALALLAVGSYFFATSRHKLAIGAACLALGIALVAFMPEKWSARMGSLNEIFDKSEQPAAVEEVYKVDSSAGSRLQSWRYAIQIANDRPLIGGGFTVHESKIANAKYQPDRDKIRAAHSVYFEVIGEHGWLGFLLYMTVWGLLWRRLSLIRKLTRRRPDLAWLYDLATMAKVSFVAFAVGGTFLNLATFDLFWHIVAIAIVAHEMARKAVKETPATEGGAPAEGRAPALAAAGGGLSGFLKQK